MSPTKTAGNAEDRDRVMNVAMVARQLPACQLSYKISGAYCCYHLTVLCFYIILILHISLTPSPKSKVRRTVFLLPRYNEPFYHNE